MLFMHVYPSSILYIRFLDAPSSRVLQSSIQNGRKWKICIRFLGRFEHTKTPALHTSTPKKAAKKLNTKLRWDETVRALWTSCPTTQRCLPEKRRFFFFAGFLFCAFRNESEVGKQNRSQLGAPLVILDKETVVEQNKFQWHRPQQSEGPKHILNHHLDESSTCGCLLWGRVTLGCCWESNTKPMSNQQWCLWVVVRRDAHFNFCPLPKTTTYFSRWSRRSTLKKTISRTKQQQKTCLKK